MRKILFILLLSIFVFGDVPSVTNPFEIIAGQPAKASEVQGVHDTTINRLNMVIDTLNRKNTSVATDTAIIDSAKIVKAEIDTAQIDTAYITYQKSSRINTDSIKANSTDGLTILSKLDSVVFIDSLSNLFIGRLKTFEIITQSASPRGLEINKQVPYLSLVGKGASVINLFTGSNDTLKRSFDIVNLGNKLMFRGLADSSNATIKTYITLNADSGNVGIDTTTPDKKLVVAGSARIRDTLFCPVWSGLSNIDVSVVEADSGYVANLKSDSSDISNLKSDSITLGAGTI